MSAVRPISKVANLRDEAGLTQLELAQKVGVTETTIANWEKGRSGTDWFERVIRLCDALHCSAKDLLEYQPACVPDMLQGSGLSLPEVQKLIRGAQSIDSPSNVQQISVRPAETETTDYQEEGLQK